MDKILERILDGLRTGVIVCAMFLSISFAVIIVQTIILIPIKWLDLKNKGETDDSFSKYFKENSHLIEMIRDVFAKKSEWGTRLTNIFFFIAWIIFIVLLSRGFKDLE